MFSADCVTSVSLLSFNKSNLVVFVCVTFNKLFSVFRLRLRLRFIIFLSEGCISGKTGA